MQNELKLYSKEFYEVMNHFEKISKKIVSFGHQGLQKEDKQYWVKQLYYCDGNVNNAFKLFLSGVQYGISNND